MKKIACLASLCLLLVGCATVDPDVREVDYNKYYQEDLTVYDQIGEIGISFYKEYTSEPQDEWKRNKPESSNAINIGWEEITAKQKPISESESIKELDDVLPGVKAFVESMEAETVNNAPQSKVINNTVITMTPRHLYTDENKKITYSGYFTLTSKPYGLVDEYLKELAAPMAKDLFVLSAPRVSGETKMLNFTTPAFDARALIGYREADGVQYEDGALCYQLYTKEEQLTKVRVIYKKISDEEANPALFVALQTLCKEQWTMSEEEIAEVKTLAQEVMEGKQGSHKGRVGDYSYTYQAEPNVDFERYNLATSQPKKEMIVEFAIEKK